MSDQGSSPTAMVWGASGGIGRALVEALARDGWRVLAVTRDAAGSGDLPATVLEGDAADDYAVREVMLRAGQAAGPIDLWIYAAGDIASSKAAEMEDVVWRRIVESNLSGAWRTVHHALPYVADEAHLVFLGAVSERLRLPGLAAYAAAKAGLEALAAVLAKEERRKRVTVVRPGAVATDFWDKVPLNLPKDAMTPAALARRVLDAHNQGHAGTLDITHGPPAGHSTKGSAA